MKRTNVCLTNQQRGKLSEIAADCGLTPSELIRRAIDSYVEAWEQKQGSRKKTPHGHDAKRRDSN